MRRDATRFRWEFLMPALFTTILTVAGGRAEAQVDPLWDHYKAYATPLIQNRVQVGLTDQFETTTQLTQYLEWFAVPVQKVHSTVVYPINNPVLHYSWYSLSFVQPPLFSKDVIATNQFGDQLIHVAETFGGEADYLLNPALKNAPAGTPIPVANHYKCYPCTGASITANLILTDQFFTRNATVLVPRFFCTPVEKRTPDGLIYPIVDPRQHYVVYDIGFDNSMPFFPANIQDQFLTAQVDLRIDRLLMVPSLKSFPTPTRSSSWGRLKIMYR